MPFAVKNALVRFCVSRVFRGHALVGFCAFCAFCGGLQIELGLNLITGSPRGGRTGRPQVNMSRQMMTEATTPARSAIKPAATAWRARRLPWLGVPAAPQGADRIFLAVEPAE